MSFSTHGRFRQQVRFLRRQFLQDGELPYTDVLSDETVAHALAALNVAWLDRIYSVPHVSESDFIDIILKRARGAPIVFQPAKIDGALLGGTLTRVRVVLVPNGRSRATAPSCAL